MKIQLELNVCEDDTMYLNFWNYLTGDDVIVELQGDKLFLIQQTEEENEETMTEISIADYLKKVRDTWIRDYKNVWGRTPTR